MHKLQTNAQVIKIHLYNAEIREIWQFVKFWAFLWTKYKTNLTQRVYRVGPQTLFNFSPFKRALLMGFGLGSHRGRGDIYWGYIHQKSPSFVANAVQLLPHFNEHCWCGVWTWHPPSRNHLRRRGSSELLSPNLDIGIYLNWKWF